jgi:hypothetical protein
MCPLCLGEEDVNRVLLRCPEARQWRMEFSDKKLLNINDDTVYTKVLRCTNTALVILPCRYLDEVKYKLLNNIKDL